MIAILTVALLFGMFGMQPRIAPRFALLAFVRWPV